VPLDDENTMQIGYWRAPEGKAIRDDVGFGQDGSRSYAERQRPRRSKLTLSSSSNGSHGSQPDRNTPFDRCM
jgi:hypothetical protein